MGGIPVNIVCEPGKKLSDSEREAIRYINENQRSISSMSISDLAERAYVSTSTISRAVRKCGFENLTEMKYRLSSEWKEEKSYVINNILSKSYNECTRTIENINIDNVVSIVGYLRSARMVYLLACGLTSLVAEEFEFQLHCQRFNVCTISDPEIMRRLDKLVTEDDLVIVLTVKNTSPDLYHCATLARKNNAKVVLLCCKNATPLEKVSDISIIGYFQPITPNAAFGSTSRLGLFIITRTIIEYLIADDLSLHSGENV